MCTGSLSRRHFISLLPGAAMTVALGACSDKGTGPVAVKWGKEYCDYCGMIVDDPRFAAQVRGGPGAKVWKFDDLGDGVLWLAKQSWANDPMTEFWVGDVEKGTWLDGRLAFYLPGKKSPMGHNLGAIADKRDSAMSFAEMRKLVVERGSTSRCETPNEGHS